MMIIISVHGMLEIFQNRKQIKYNILLILTKPFVNENNKEKY